MKGATAVLSATLLVTRPPNQLNSRFVLLMQLVLEFTIQCQLNRCCTHLCIVILLVSLLIETRKIQFSFSNYSCSVEIKLLGLVCYRGAVALQLVTPADDYVFVAKLSVYPYACQSV